MSVVLAKPKAILLDIEGTTSSISFVHDVLFPYSAEKMPEFLRQNQHNPQVQEIIDQVADDQEESARINFVAEHFCDLIRRDVKDPLLKTLQGMIWKEGFEAKAYEGHVYPEVKDCLEAWKDCGIDLYIFSSGSVAAQKLLFKHTLAGNLLPLFSGHFDLSTGIKRDPASYRTIAQDIGQPPERILFLSDIKEELVAATEAGQAAVQVRRQNLGNPDQFTPWIKDFSELAFS